MASAEKEEIFYLDPIDVNEGDKKGNVENWLLEVESQMRKSLKKITVDALHDYVNTKRPQWVRKWAGQVVLAISQVYWTMGVEKSIKEGTLDEYEKLLNDQIEDIVQMVRGELPTNTRTTLKALVVIDVHARDVVRELLRKNVQKIDEFDWIA